MGYIETLYKRRCETPLEAIGRIKTDEPKSYAGRLDPVAEGLLLVLVGDENKNREKYLSLDKVYVVDILWGVSTDTGDILGLSEEVKFGEKVESFSRFVGKQVQKYPAYSSKTVNGKPLWVYAREGSLDKIEIPERDIEIYSIDVLKSWKKDVSDDIRKTIKSVKGDFRQNEILSSWEKIVFHEVSLTRLRIACSSGTYIRQFAKNLGVAGCVFRLVREKVGEYSI